MIYRYLIRPSQGRANFGITCHFFQFLDLVFPIQVDGEYANKIYKNLSFPHCLATVFFQKLSLEFF
jgi:hypothetical protein